MGLDAVEIVIEVEAAFDIQIEDAEAKKILTQRDLIDLITIKQLGCARTYREDASFVRDLGLG